MKIFYLVDIFSVSLHVILENQSNMYFSDHNHNYLEENKLFARSYMLIVTKQMNSCMLQYA